MSSPPSLPEAHDQLTPTEEILASMWRDALGLCELPRPADNFFALGGDSTAMVMVELRIQEDLSIELPPGSMLSTSSLRELACLIGKSSAPSSALVSPDTPGAT